MNEAAWQNLEADKKHKLPTPPVGWPVQWYPGGDKRKAVAASVVAVEMPGRVKLKVLAVNSFPTDKAGVWHASARLHEKQNNQTTVNCGSWDYLPGMEIPKLHWVAYDQDIERREQGLLEAEDRAARQTSHFQENQAKKQVEAKKKLPEILPAPA